MTSTKAMTMTYGAAKRAYNALYRRNRFLTHESEMLPDTIDENIVEMRDNVKMMGKLLDHMIELRMGTTA